MTLEEIYNKYVDLVILILEEEGIKNNNNVYKNVENILKEKHKNTIERSISDEIDFELFIILVIALILGEIHGPDNLQEKETASGLALDLFNRYLREATKRFSSKYGISFDEDRMNDLEVKIINIKNGNGKFSD